jgi:hypothetical protein
MVSFLFFTSPCMGGQNVSVGGQGVSVSGEQERGAGGRRGVPLGGTKELFGNYGPEGELAGGGNRLVAEGGF